MQVESLRCSRPDSAGSASSSSCDGPEQVGAVHQIAFETETYKAVADRSPATQQYEELQLTVRIPRPHRQPGLLLGPCWWSLTLQHMQALLTVTMLCRWRPCRRHTRAR